MPAVEFIDTNIWAYAHLRMPNEPKHPLALALIKALKNAAVSPQVIAEYYWVFILGLPNSRLRTRSRLCYLVFRRHAIGQVIDGVLTVLNPFN